MHAEITNYLRPKKLVGNIAGTIQMMSEKVSEPIIDQNI